MPRLELISQKISKRLSMQNGILSMINLIRLSRVEPRLSFLTYQLVILPLNTLLTEIFSAPVEFRKMISKELLKPPEPFCKLPSMASLIMFWELAENSRKSKSEMKDSICSLIARTPRVPPWSLEVEPLNFWRRPKDL